MDNKQEILANVYDGLYDAWVNAPDGDVCDAIGHALDELIELIEPERDMIHDTTRARKLAGMVRQVCDELELVASPALRCELKMRTLDTIARHTDVPFKDLTGTEREVARVFRQVLEGK